MRYLWAAFKARPWGMPVAPNLIFLAATGLLGGLLDPAFLAIGAGLEVAYLALLARSPRFRAVVDADEGTPSGAPDARRKALVQALPPADRRAQEELEARCAEIVRTLEARGSAGAQADGLGRLSFMHLRLLDARTALRRLVAGGDADRTTLEAQAQRLTVRLAEPDLAPDLRHTLEQQAEVIGKRREAHAEGERRLERVDAELDRIQQQVALVRDQALLAADEDQVARSVDALAASLEEAHRWFQEERDLFGDLDDLSAPPTFPAPKGSARRRGQGSQGETE
ncbi:MAG: hypothetical protein QM767_27615 [Anaeromyxobacter sp.]